MGFNIHILSGRNRSTNLAGHAALAASFNPQQCDIAHWEVAAAQPGSLPGKAQDKAVVLLPIICIEPHKP
jgi:hypothetical protein